MQDDALWVKQTLAGDEKAFHRLIIKYYSAIFTIALSWSKNAEDAGDLVQEIFFEAYLDLASLKHHEQFRVWLRQIARHQCHDWLRKRRETFISLDENVVFGTPSADETLILRETLAKVMEAIDGLPESESQLLKERYLDDVSYGDLESKYGLSRNALAVRLFRARHRVREKLKMVTGVLALTWRDAVRRILTGGSLAMKIGAKVKIIIAITSAVVILGGTGFVVWHYQQASQEITSDSFDDQTIQKTTLLSDKEQASAKSMTVSDDNTKKLIETQKVNVKETKTDKQINPTKEVAIQEIKEPEIKETPLQKYQRIWYSPEFQVEFANATAPYDDEYQRHKEGALALLQKKTNLENDLANSSGEEHDKIQRDLEKVETDYKEARIQASMSMTMMMNEGERIELKYFNPEEFHEAIFQLGESMGNPSPMPLPTKEESESVGNITFSPEEWSEAERRLNARGINTKLMPPPSQALFEKYVLNKI